MVMWSTGARPKQKFYRWTRTSVSTTASSVFRSGSIVVGAALIGCLLWVALGRLFYPYELEWMEGGSVDHVRWILAGHPLYVAPTLAFIPYVYAPLYYYLASCLCWFVGVGFWPLRAISLAATSLTLLVVYKLIRHETESRWAGYLATAFYAGTFPLTGYWFDLARVDPLEILFLSLALYAVRRYDSLKAAMVAGLCLALAFLTKQTALFGVLPIGLYLLVQSRRRLGAFLLAVGVTSGGAIALLDHFNRGWLRYYTVTLPSNHETNASAYLDFWTGDVSRLLPLALATLVAVWLVRRLDRMLRSKLFFYGVVLAVFLGISYGSRIHAGGEQNVLMPAFLAAALMFGLVAHTLKTLSDRRSLLSDGTPSGRAPQPRAMGLHLFILIQLALFLYGPWKQLPSRADRLAGDAFVSLLRSIEGEVYLVDHGYYPALAGKRTFAQGMALVDVLRGDPGLAGRQVAAELVSAVRERRFAAVIVGTEVPSGHAVDNPAWNECIHLPWMPADFLAGLALNYEPTRYLYRDSRDFVPVVGWRRRPAVVYQPRTDR